MPGVAELRVPSAPSSGATRGDGFGLRLVQRNIEQALVVIGRDGVDGRRVIRQRQFIE